MPRMYVQTRQAWQDRYRTPAIQSLRDGLDRVNAHIFDHARKSFLSMEGVGESVVWMGIPWRWTVLYGSTGPESGGSLAYLIPQPGRFQLAVPLTTEMVSALPVKRLSRYVRDGITFAPRVEGVFWARWDVGAKAAFDELFEVVRRKHQALSPAPA